MGLTFSYVFCLNFVSLDYKLLPTQRLKKHVFIMQPFLWVKSLGLTATSAHDLPRLQVSARCMSIRSPDQGRARSRLVQAGGRIYFRAPARLETPVSRWPSGGSCSPVSEATYTIPFLSPLSLQLILHIATLNVLGNRFCQTIPCLTLHWFSLLIRHRKALMR